MASTLDAMGEVANIAQLTGLDAVKLIGLIATAANTARMHKKNCRQFAQHLKLIGNLLKQLKISELKKYPETREPLEQLEDALRRSYVLVTSCQDRSYLYLLAMGWNIVYQFRKAQNEIDRYLKLVPLITLVDNARVRERLEYIEKDQREYTLDEEDRKVQTVILNPDSDTGMLEKNLSRSYNCSFDEALRKENEKLRLELHRSQQDLNVNQCEMILRLLQVTEAAAESCRKSKVVYDNYNQKVESMYTDDEKHVFDERPSMKAERNKSSRSVSGTAGHDAHVSKVSYQHEEWNTDLLDCCAEPCLCMKTLFYPCGTFARIASVANNKHMSSGEACNDLLAYSLILSCCCYTCCVRSKLRKMLNITGGVFDDFLSHFMCCCCALVQEWREVEIRGVYGQEKTKTSPPPSQFMES